jgi:hypothetical protein
MYLINKYHFLTISTKMWGCFSSLLSSHTNFLRSKNSASIKTCRNIVRTMYVFGEQKTKQELLMEDLFDLDF